MIVLLNKTDRDSLWLASDAACLQFISLSTKQKEIHRSRASNGYPCGQEQFPQQNVSPEVNTHSLKPGPNFFQLPGQWFGRTALIASALLMFVITSSDTQAQSLFRKPAIPNARTVSSQVIDRANIPIILGREESTGHEAALAQGSDTRTFESIDSIEPTTSFLPLPEELETPDFETGRTIDDLSEEEFESRLRSLQHTEDDSLPPALESIDDDSSQLTEPDFPTERSGRETIRQRYPDGKTHILRQVAQDAAGNYFNDGAWRVHSRTGDVIAEGQFKKNQMVGQWRRYHSPGSGGLFSTAPFNKYEGRFLSVAQFDDGKLDGAWTIYDQNNQKVFEVGYSKGKRDGAATWWYPTATKMREATFRKGLLNGKVLEWDEQGKLTRRDEFIRGQRVVRQVSRYRPDRPSEEQYYLDGKLVLDGEDQWWEAKPASFSTAGQKVQQGPIRRWYENGQPKMRGQYDKDQRVGKFTWWHGNGGRKLEAAYKKGQKAGIWTWWHENGMKSIQGEYETNEAVGVWTWWDEEGNVSRQENFDKRSLERDGAVGELTEPSGSDSDRQKSDDSDQTSSIMEDMAEEETETTDSSGDSDSAIPLLLDTDDLEDIDLPDTAAGELPDPIFGDASP